MREVLRWRELVVQPVDIGDGDIGELFLGDVFQAADVDAVHLPDGRLGSDTEWSNAASSTEEVKILESIEPVPGELCLAHQKTEVLRSRDRRPKAVSAADRTIAAIRGLSEIEVCFEPDRSAMAASAVCFEHDYAMMLTKFGGA